MQITLSPIRSDTQLVLTKSGDILTMNGTAFDFSAVPEGGSLNNDTFNCDWLASDVRRVGGVLRLTLLLPHGRNAPHSTRYPDPATITVTDGPVTLPAYDAAP